MKFKSFRVLSLGCLASQVVFHFTVLALFFSAERAFSQEENPDTQEEEGINPEVLANSCLRDNNGDGVISLAAFGDSITRGVGDGISVGERIFETTVPEREAGYPLRVELLLSVPVSNLGDPGERISTDGLIRFAGSIPSVKPDVVVISGGANDARDGIEVEDFSRSIQTMINIAQASGAKAVLATTPPTCCNHFFLTPNVLRYNEELRTLSAINNLAIARCS